MRLATSKCARVTMRRWRHALLVFALVASALCAPALFAVPKSASAAAAAGADALRLPASWEGKLSGADGTVRWHLDLLPEQRYRLRRTYEGKAAPNRFDEIGRWLPAADSPRLELYVAHEKRLQFLVEPDGSLRKLDTAGGPSPAGPNERLERLPQPQLIEPRLKLSGQFVYMADAGVITLCADGSRMPVAKEGDFIALEGAYRNAQPTPGQALLVHVEGRIALRPSMEESAPPLDTLMVERFISVSPHGSCDTSPPLEGTAWTLSTLGGQTAAAGATATARFAGGRVQGTNGCNRYSAPIVVRGTNIEISRNAAATNMACPTDVMQRADAFMTALFSARSFRITGRHLDLLGADRAVLATFSAQSGSLAGTSWRATGINNGREAVVSVVTGTTVTMDFAAAGKVAGSAGCNHYTTTYTQEGGKLTFAAAAATRLMCAAPGVMEQEHAFLKALETVATAQVEGDELELRTAEGALAVSLVRKPGS